MRRIFIALLCLASLTLLFSCSSSRKMSNYVPFTRDLRTLMEKDNIDLKEVQFYVDQKLVLSKDLGEEKVVVKSGVVKLENGRYINEVVIPSLTPGLCEQVNDDKLQISFERGNNSLAFGPGSGPTYNNYVLYGTQWKNGTALVDYDASKFRARCATCSDVASTMLVIRKKVKDRLERKSRTLKGRTVGK